MREEAVPEVSLGHRIPCPVRLLGVGEDNARRAQLVVVIAPHIAVALGGTRRGLARRLKPGMLVRGVVDHQLDHHLHVATVSGIEKGTEIVQRPVGWVHVAIVGDVVAVIPQRRWKEGQQPEARDAQVLQVVELLQETAEVAYPVVVAVEERLDRQLIDDGVLVPERVACTSAALHGGSCLPRRVPLPSGRSESLPRSRPI